MCDVVIASPVINSPFREPDRRFVFGDSGITNKVAAGRLPSSYLQPIHGPSTGAINSSSTDDIASWFVDTNYNGESFFVRHAYFTGADEPYEKVQRALRAEIDEAAWRSLYATVIRPFAKPEMGRIAVKVINHYGDEVLKVVEVR